MGSSRTYQYSDEYYFTSLTIDSDGSFFFIKKFDFEPSNWVKQQDVVGVYLDFYFDIYKIDNAIAAGTINVTEVELKILGSNVQSPDPVPVPSAIILLFSGILGLAGVSRKKYK